MVLSTEFPVSAAKSTSGKQGDLCRRGSKNTTGIYDSPVPRSPPFLNTPTRPATILSGTGAVIGDGDRKSWDPRAPMIWENFSIFRTNCAILTSYIRADPRTCQGFSRWCQSRCMIKWWELKDSFACFSQRWQGIRQGLRTRALICSFMLWAKGKGGFFRVENKTSISRWERRSARASCKLTRMLLRLFWLKNIARKLSTLHGIELICEFLGQWLIITKTCFDVSYCFCLFGEFAKVFGRKVWRLQLARLHSAARALSSPGRCFQLSTDLDKDFFRYLLCWDAATNFRNAKKATNIMSASST